MSDEFTWWYGAGDEAERYLPAKSRDEAIALATQEALEDGHKQMSVAEGRPQTLADRVDADSVLENWHSQNEEAADEDGELHMNPTPEQVADLEAALTAAFAEWRSRHKLGRAFMLEVKNVEVIDIEQAANDA